MIRINQNVSAKETIYVNQSKYQYERGNVQRISRYISTRKAMYREPIRISVRERQHKQNQSKCQYERDNIGRISQDVSTSDAM